MLEELKKIGGENKMEEEKKGLPVEDAAVLRKYALWHFFSEESNLPSEDVNLCHPCMAGGCHCGGRFPFRPEKNL